MSRMKMTAMNGVLLFGWSTAVIFELLRRAMMRGSALLTVGSDVKERAGGW
jgi:hypothetical protein